MFWLTAAVIAVQVQTDGAINFQDGQGFFLLRNFGTNGIQLNLVDRAVTFKGTGSPLLVQQLDQGIRFEAKFMDGTAVEGPKGYVPARLMAKGEVHLVLDTDAADAFFREKRLPEVKRTSHSKSDVRSAELQYQRVDQSGTATLPKAFELLNRSFGITKTKVKDKLASVNFDQTLTATGSSGTVGFDFDPKGKPVLSEGEFQGPVRIFLTRTEVFDGVTIPKVSTLLVTTQRVKLTRTLVGYDLVADGKMHLEGTGEYFVTADGETALLKLDPDLKPLTITWSGAPAKTTVLPGGGR